MEQQRRTTKNLLRFLQITLKPNSAHTRKFNINKFTYKRNTPVSEEVDRAIKAEKPH